MERLEPVLVLQAASSSAALRGEGNCAGSRPDERGSEAGEHGQVGVERDPLDAPATTPRRARKTGSVTNDRPGRPLPAPAAPSLGYGTSVSSVRCCRVSDAAVTRSAKRTVNPS